ncbi:MAG: hypothetical protein AB7G87_03980, partial [Clostridia bacterium]
MSRLSKYLRHKKMVQLQRIFTFKRTVSLSLIFFYLFAFCTAVYAPFVSAAGGEDNYGSDDQDVWLENNTLFIRASSTTATSGTKYRTIGYEASVVINGTPYKTRLDYSNYESDKSDIYSIPFTQNDERNTAVMNELINDNPSAENAIKNYWAHPPNDIGVIKFNAVMIILVNGDQLGGQYTDKDSFFAATYSNGSPIYWTATARRDIEDHFGKTFEFGPQPVDPEPTSVTAMFTTRKTVETYQDFGYKDKSEAENSSITKRIIEVTGPNGALYPEPLTFDCISKPYVDPSIVVDKPGTYHIKLKVENNKGDSDTYEDNITVINPDDLKLIMVCDAPSQADINETFTVSAKDSRPSKGAKIIKYRWYAGNSESSLQPLPEFDDSSEIQVTYSDEGMKYFRVEGEDTAGKTGAATDSTKVIDGRVASAKAALDGQDPFYEGVFGWVSNRSRFYCDGDTYSARKADEEGVGNSYWEWYRDRDGNGGVDRHERLESNEYELGRGDDFESATGGLIAFDFVDDVYIEIEADPRNGESSTAMIKRPVLPTPHAGLKAEGDLKENRKIVLTNNSIYHRLYPSAYVEFRIKNKDTGDSAVITPTSNSTSSYIKNLDMYVDSYDKEKVELIIKKPGKYEFEIHTKDTRGHEDTEVIERNIIPDQVPVVKAKVRNKYFRKPVVTNENLEDESYSPDGDIMNARTWTYKYDSDNDNSFSDETNKTLGTNKIQSLGLSQVGSYQGNVSVKEDIDFTIPNFLSDSDYKRNNMVWNFEVDNVKPVTTAEIGMSTDADIHLLSENSRLSYFESNAGTLESGLLNNGTKLISPSISVGGFETSSSLLIQDFNTTHGSNEIEAYTAGYFTLNGGSETSKTYSDGNLVAYYAKNIVDNTVKIYVRDARNSTIIKIFDANTYNSQVSIEGDYVYFSSTSKIVRVNKYTLEIMEYILNGFDGVAIDIINVIDNRAYLKETIYTYDYLNRLSVSYNFAEYDLISQISNYKKINTPVENVYEYNGITYVKLLSEGTFYKIINQNFVLVYQTIPKTLTAPVSSGSEIFNFTRPQTRYSFNDKYLYMLSIYSKNYRKDNLTYVLFFTKVDITTGQIVYDKRIDEHFSGSRSHVFSIRSLYKERENIVLFYDNVENGGYDYLTIKKIGPTGNIISEYSGTTYAYEAEFVPVISQNKPENKIPIYDAYEDGRYCAFSYIGVNNSSTDSFFTKVYDVITGQIVYSYNERARGNLVQSYGASKYIAIWQWDDERRYDSTVWFRIIDIATQEVIYEKNAITASMVYFNNDKAYIGAADYVRNGEPVNGKVIIVDLNTKTELGTTSISTNECSFIANRDLENILAYNYDEMNTRTRIWSYRVNKGFYEIIDKLDDFIVRVGSHRYIPIVTTSAIQSDTAKNDELVAKANALGAKIIFVGSSSNSTLGSSLATRTDGIFYTHSSNANSIAKIKDYIISDVNNEIVVTKELYLKVNERYNANPKYTDYENDTLDQTLYKLTNSTWNGNDTGWITTYPNYFTTTGVRYLGIKQKDKPSTNTSINNEYAKWSDPYVIKIVVSDGTIEPPEQAPMPPDVQIQILSDQGENVAKERRRVDFIIIGTQGTDPINWSSLKGTFNKTDHLPYAAAINVKEFSRVFTTIGSHSITVELSDTTGRKTIITKSFTITADAEPVAGFTVSGSGKRSDDGYALFKVNSTATSNDDQVGSIDYYIKPPAETSYYFLPLTANNEVFSGDINTTSIKQIITETYTNGIGLNGEDLDQYRVFKSKELIRPVTVTNEAPTLTYSVAPGIIRVNEAVSHSVEYQDDTATGETMKYRFYHEPNYYQNSQGLNALSGVIADTPTTVLDKKGRYSFESMVTDENGANSGWVSGGSVIVCTSPISDFELYANPAKNNGEDREFSTNFFKSGSIITVGNNSINTDYGDTVENHGISYYKLEFRDITDTNWQLITEQNNLTNYIYRTDLPQITDRGIYEVRQTIRSIEGIEASITKQFTLLELRMDASLTPDTVYASQKYKIKAVLSKDAQGAVAKIHDG